MPTKIHLRGLDALTTKDIEAYAAEHFPAEKPKVEWVDGEKLRRFDIRIKAKVNADTSANLAYDDALIASEALHALTVTFNGSMPHELQLRNGKSFSSKPTVELQVRLATTEDRKTSRAHERSRFYMMHPEHDPRERTRGDPEYRKRRYPRRRRSVENNRFDVSLYDDRDARSSSSRSYSSDHRGSRNSRPQRRRNRDRSASPSGATSDYRRRDRPPPKAPQVENKGKELFPAGTKIDVVANNAKKELFPQRKSGATALHRRNNSIDATHDFTTDVLSSSLSKTMSVPFLDGSTDNIGRGLRSDSMIKKTDGFSIRGAAGFSIRGAAAANTEAKVKELFPVRISNKGKELFTSRVRKQAEEFY